MGSIISNSIIPQKFPLSHSAYQKMNTCGLSYDLYYNKKIKNKYSKATMISGRVFDEVFNEFLRCVWNQNNFDLKNYFEKVWHDEYVSKEKEAKNTDLSLYESIKYICSLIPQSYRDSGIVPYSTVDGEPCVQHKHTFDIGYGVKVTTIIDLIGFSQRLNKPVIIDVKACAPSALASKEFVSISEQLLIYSLSAEADPRLNCDSFDFGAYWQGERKAMPALKKDQTLRAGARYPQIIKPEIERFNDFHKSQMADRYIHTQLDINKGKFFGGSRMAYNSPCSLCDYAGLCIKGDNSGLIKKPEYRRKIAK